MTIPPRRVLLVEGDRFLRRTCEASLRERGFAVQTATNGEEGLALALNEPFDAILLDLLMPKKPGIEVLAAIRSTAGRAAATPVLVLSNSSRDEDRRQALELGAQGYYAKANLSLKALGDELARLLSVA